ncbi:MAG: glycosyltransferase family 4 protein [Methylobacillus sp.]|jgi:glycosyltransferase involved in cell wall biosynthesis|nr:glycosyltransferase family 4 protein [Methylobacillus sp.]
MRIVHLTSVHPRYDTRIFLKECSSLAQHGYEVALVVADGRGNEIRDDVSIIDVGRATGRLNRMVGITRLVYDKAAELDADIYHLHDPELLPVGLKLKRRGKEVIFDTHEDVPRQLLSKPYLHPFFRHILAWGFAHFERYACVRLDGVIAATPFIRDKFLKINPRTVDINNFPMLGELSAQSDENTARTQVCYVGGIEAVRGIREIVRAMEKVSANVRLELAGAFTDPELSAEVRGYAGWQRVDERGFVDRAGVRAILGRSFAGLVTLHPISNYLDALPVKMFEYMSAGIPVIASNFPLWREIIEGNDCGLCVDPSRPDDIANAINFLAQNPEQARAMGANGQRAVRERYNWAVEEKKLLVFYTRLQKGMT